MAKLKDSLNFKVGIFIIVFSVVVVFAALFGCYVFINKTFKKTVDPFLLQKAENVSNSFVSNVNKEMALSEKMVLSPVIRKYMKDPSDPEWHDIGLAELRSYEERFASKLSFWISDADKHYFANCEDKYVLDVNESGSEWYPISLNAEGNYTFYVDFEKSLNATFLWVNGIVRDDDGTPLGLAGTGVPLSDFIKSVYEGFDDRITMYMYNTNFEVTAARDKKLMEERVSVKSLLPNVVFPEGFVDEPKLLTGHDGEYVFCSMPSVGWSLVLFIPSSDKSFYDSDVMVLGALAIIISLSIVAAFSILILSIIKRIKKVLNELHNTVEQIEMGDADLNKKIPVTSKDEFSDLINEFNRFTETLRVIVSDIQRSEEDLSEAGNGLNNIMQVTTSTVRNIMVDVDSTSLQIEMQTSSVDKTATSIGKITDEISSLDKMISNQVDSVSNASSSIQEMIDNISAVTTSVENMAATFDELRQNTKIGAQKQAAVNDTIQHIFEQSQMLQEANMTISAIAEQTNLLAMNAAIEAAHAGEAGKGFSVVADEIRKLSETSSEQSTTIGEQLQRIENSIKNVVDTSRESQESFDEVSLKISETGDVVQGIKESMLSQLENSQQIGSILSVINCSSTDVQRASEEMAKGAEMIHSEAKQLQNVTERIRGSIETISAGAEEISRNSESLNDISSRVGDSIERMADNIGKFKV